MTATREARTEAQLEELAVEVMSLALELSKAGRDIAAVLKDMRERPAAKERAS